MVLRNLPPGLGSENRRYVPMDRGELYEAVVEYVDDPLNVGRVKARIAGLHSEDRTIEPTENLPWFIACVPPGGLHVPEVGDTILVVFRKGAVWSPVWLGVTYGNPSGPVLKGRMPHLSDPGPINREPLTASVGSFSAPAANNKITYYAPPGNEAPAESFTYRETTHPSIRVVVKTPKGHCIYTEDSTDNEYMKVVDRAGQMIEFMSKVPGTGGGGGNMDRRGVGESIKGTQLPIAKLPGGATITLMDAMNQFLQMKAADGGGCKIRMQGPGATGGGDRTDTYSKAANFIEISQSPNQLTIRCELNGEIIVDSGVTASDNIAATLDLHGGFAKLSGIRVDLN